MPKTGPTGAIASDLFARKHTRRAETLQAFDRDAVQNLICSRVQKQISISDSQSSAFRQPQP